MASRLLSTILLSPLRKGALVALVFGMPALSAAQVAPKPTAQAEIDAAYDAAAGHIFRNSEVNRLGITCSANNVPDTIGMCGSSGASRPVSYDTYYNSFQKEFYLQVKFPKNAAGQYPEGISFVVTDGPLPAKSGQWAIVSVDASKSTAAPIVNVHAYNAARSGNGILSSWNFGNTTENAPADKIITTLNPPAGFHTGTWTKAYRAPRQITVRDYVDGTAGSPLQGLALREFTINIDVAPILKSRPLYPQDATWLGISFGILPKFGTPKLGLWLWGFNGLATTYDASGFLTSWLRPVAQGFSTSSYELINKTSEAIPVDCSGTVWGKDKSCIPPITCHCTIVTPTPTPTPVPTPITPSSCVTSSLTNTLFSLDGGAAGLHEALKYGVAQAKSIAKRGGLPKRRANKLLADAEVLRKNGEGIFLQAWSISWSFPQEIVKCTGTLTPNCVAEDLSVRTTTYIDTTNALLDVVQQMSTVLRETKTARGKAVSKRLLVLGDERLQEAVDFTKAVPASTVQCVAP